MHKGTKPQTLEQRLERFYGRIKVVNDCWEWQGARAQPHGYGRFHAYVLGGPQPMWAHRFSYIVHKGPIPEGLVIDHLCRNPCCVNPEHLEAVTQRINMQRGAGRGSKPGYCKREHPLIPVPATHKNPRRHTYCPICRKETVKRYCEKKRQEAQRA